MVPRLKELIARSRFIKLRLPRRTRLVLLFRVSLSRLTMLLLMALLLSRIRRSRLGCRSVILSIFRLKWRLIMFNSRGRSRLIFKIPKLRWVVVPRVSRWGSGLILVFIVGRVNRVLLLTVQNVSEIFLKIRVVLRRGRWRTAGRKLPR